jgi:hypothetical protein
MEVIKDEQSGPVFLMANVDLCFRIDLSNKGVPGFLFPTELPIQQHLFPFNCTCDCKENLTQQRN